MAKNKKRNIFNQVVEEPEVKNEVVESTPIVIDPEVFTTKLFVEEEPEISLEELVAQEEFINEEPCVCQEPCIEPCVCDTPVVEAVKPAINPENLSRADYRHYLRTGSIPQ